MNTLKEQFIALFGDFKERDEFVEESKDINGIYLMRLNKTIVMCELNKTLSLPLKFFTNDMILISEVLKYQQEKNPILILIEFHLTMEEVRDILDKTKNIILNLKLENKLKKKQTKEKKGKI